MENETFRRSHCGLALNQEFLRGPPPARIHVLSKHNLRAADNTPHFRRRGVTWFQKEAAAARRSVLSAASGAVEVFRHVCVHPTQSAAEPGSGHFEEKLRKRE